MKRLLILLATFPLLFVSALTSADEFKVAVSETSREFFPDIIEVVSEAYERAGHTVEFMDLPGVRAGVMLGKGEIDGDVMRLANFRDTVPSAIPVEVTLTTLNIVAVVKKDSGITKNEDLVGKKIAAVRGVEVQKVVASQLNAPVTVQADFAASMKMIESGRMDFTVATTEIAEQFVGTGMALTILDEPVLQIPFYTWVSSSNADLVPDLEAALNELKAEGRF